MNIKRAKQEIKNTIEAYLAKDEYGQYLIPTVHQRPVLLLGAPGIGKTQIMEQIARECGIGLVAYTITHHTRQSAIGLPFISHKEYGGHACAVTEYTMSEIVASVYEEMEKTGLEEGILFIDEVNCVSETLAPAMLQFLQCKTFGTHQIPKGWVIAAAGNPPEYNKSVREFDVVTMDRVKKITVEPDYAVWKEYARQEGIHPAILSYLDTRPQNFYRMETTVDGRMFATPRGWEDLSRLLKVYEPLGKEADFEVVMQYVQHERTARDFANYLELYRSYQLDEHLETVLKEGRVDEILLKRVAHASMDERMSIVSILADRCMKQFEKWQEQEKYLEQLFEVLKLLKEGFLGVHASQPMVWLGEIYEDFEKEWKQKKDAKLLSHREERRYLRTWKKLEEYRTLLQEAADRSGDAWFALLKAAFDGEQEDLIQLQEQGADMLEHVFDFMETAFFESQEMVLFVTELNSNPYAIRFLREYECERYYQYNQSLLFEEKEQALRKRVEELML